MGRSEERNKRFVHFNLILRGVSGRGGRREGIRRRGRGRGRSTSAVDNEYYYQNRYDN